MKSSYKAVTGKGQSVYYKETGTLNEYKVQLDIRTDSYKTQSHAIASVWSARDLKWNTVFSIPPSLMKTDEDLGYKPTAPQVTDFAADRRVLLEQLKFVLEADTKE